MKKITLLFLICISAFQVLKAQDTLIWAAPATYPDITVAGMYNEAAVIGDTLYAHITGGLATAKIEKYYIADPSIGGGSWVPGTNLPTTLIGGYMVECGDKLYYIGGSTTGVNTAGNAVYCYDPLTSAWTAKASLPVALSGHGAVAWGDSVIFVMGGPWTTTTTTNLDVYFYRPSTDTWGTNTGASGLPSGAGRRAYAIGMDDNKIIIAGGYAGAFLQTAYVGTVGSDATQISWVQVSDIPGIYGLSRCGGTAIDGHFFLVGGEKSASGGYGDTTHVFNFTSNAWQYSFPGKPFGISNVFNSITATQLSGDTVLLFTVGGYNGVNLACFDVAKFSSFPVPTITPNGTYNLCDGDSVILTSSLADSYLWLPGGEATQTIVVYAGGTYTVSVTNSDPMNGVGISLPTIVNLITINTAVTQTGTSLSADAAGMDAYQWVDCDNSYADIVGENSQEFIPSVSGNYAVIIDNDGCTDTSSCYLFTVGLEEFAVQYFSVYPNPAHDVITINPSVNETVGNIEVLNIFGQVIDVVQMHGKTDLNISGYPAGLYIVQMKETGFAVSFVKE